MPLGVLAVVGLLFALLGPVAWWATPAKHLQGKDKADVRNATRQVLLAAVGGLVLLAGAGFTARTFFLTRRGQLTDRYTKAITQLASDKLTERLGGVYALEHLMAESERDHSTVVEVLAAFIRERARDRPAEDEPYERYGTAAWKGPPPDTDVQAALTVLGRRPDRPEPQPIDLSQTDLRRADLTGARLHGARFFRTDLRGAYLDGADLQEADMLQARLGSAWMRGTLLREAHIQAAGLPQTVMTGAQLQQARLGHSRLTGARLEGANLVGAKLAAADLTGTDLTGADLTGADLTGARLWRGHPLPPNVKGLTEEQLRGALLDHETWLPPPLAHLRPPAPKDQRDEPATAAASPAETDADLPPADLPPAGPAAPAPSASPALAPRSPAQLDARPGTTPGPAAGHDDRQ
jgi:hypothetical protein